MWSVAAVSCQGSNGSAGHTSRGALFAVGSMVAMRASLARASRPPSRFTPTILDKQRSADGAGARQAGRDQHDHAEAIDVGRVYRLARRGLEIRRQIGGYLGPGQLAALASQRLARG